MNHAALARLEQMTSALEAAVRDDLARHTDEELDELLMLHMDCPTLILGMAMAHNPGKMAAMAAVPLQRERLRRAELKAMETSNVSNG